jgi:hypothetical protein
MAWPIKEGTSVTYIKLFLGNGLTNKRGDIPFIGQAITQEKFDIGH